MTCSRYGIREKQIPPRTGTYSRAIEMMQLHTCVPTISKTLAYLFDTMDAVNS